MKENLTNSDMLLSVGAILVELDRTREELVCRNLDAEAKLLLTTKLEASR